MFIVFIADDNDFIKRGTVLPKFHAIHNIEIIGDSTLYKKYGQIESQSNGAKFCTNARLSLDKFNVQCKSCSLVLLK
jgi:hypothetical protein